MDKIEIVEKTFSILHWVFTILYLLPLTLGIIDALYSSIKLDIHILFIVGIIGYFGMWICSAISGSAVGDSYDNYGDS